MIPSAYSISMNGKLTNSINTQDNKNIRQEVKQKENCERQQTVINNYYIPDENCGWKQVETSEILPNKLHKSDPHHTIPNKGENSSLRKPQEHTNNNTTTSKTSQERKESSMFYKEEATIQNMMAPPQSNPMCNLNYPPPVGQTGTAETTAMLDCIRQLQLMVQQVLMNGKQAEYHMSQNADLLTEMIKAQNRRELDPAIMAIPTFSGKEPEKCLDWINRLRNICSQSE